LQVNSLNLIVTPEQAVELKAAEFSGGVQFLLCGDKAVPNQKAVPQQSGTGLTIPPGKRLVTIIPDSWQLPVGTLKIGSKVDLFEIVSGENSHKPRLAFPNLEVAAFSARRIDRDSPAVGESSENVWINTISFVVEPKLAEELKEFQVRVSYSSINGGATQFVLRGDQDETKPQPAIGGSADLQSTLQEFIKTACLELPSSAEVLASLPERNRHNMRIAVEPITLRLDQPVFYPMIGHAQLIHCHFKCTVSYDIDQPVPSHPSDSYATEVVYIDHDRLVRANGHHE
jgi:hypothetical protein